MRAPVTTPADAGFVELLTATLEALPPGDAHVDAALRLVTDHLGVLSRSGTRWRVDTTGLARLADEPGVIVAARARALLETGTELLGFTPDPAAPGGVRRLARTLSPTLKATLDSRHLTVATTGAGVPLGTGSALNFSVVADVADGGVSAMWGLSAAGALLERTATGALQLRLSDDPAPVVRAPGADGTRPT